MRTFSHLEENYISPSAPRLNAFNKPFYSEFIKQVSGKDRSKPKKDGFRSGFKPQFDDLVWSHLYFLALKCV